MRDGAVEVLAGQGDRVFGQYGMDGGAQPEPQVGKFNVGPQGQITGPQLQLKR